MFVVPPKESITPRRKQNLYDFANEVFNYGNELLSFKDSKEFELETQEQQDYINEELALIEKLNDFQVSQITTW